MALTSDNPQKAYKETFILIASVFIAGLCSIVYELLISTASSYFLGDSVRQFSITIGLSMAAMGVGSFLSRLIVRNILSKFIAIEILLGFVGGISIPVLYTAYAYTNAYTFFMVMLILLIGVLIGLEIPLLTRIMEQYYVLKVNISNVLSVDYLGALIATLLFPFILLPLLGTFRSSLVFGIVNMGIGFMNLWCFSEKLRWSRRIFYRYASISVCVVLLGLLVSSQFLIKRWSRDLYEDRVILSKQTRYQKLVLTKNKEDIRLYLNGNLQFSSIDEYRYHEALTHIPMSMLPHHRKILILGGGDGLVVRELLKYSGIDSIDLVDLDPEMTNLARQNPHIVRLNQNALSDARVTVMHQDALVFLKDRVERYDLIISDLPDPNNVSLARLYSKEFYRLVLKHLSREGIFVTQATSPFFAKKAFWCIHNTIQAAGFDKVLPYHVYVPSFGDWGFVIASRRDMNPEAIEISVATRYLDEPIIRRIFTFEKDLLDTSSEVSTMDRPEVMTYYFKGWRYWN